LTSNYVTYFYLFYETWDAREEMPEEVGAYGKIWRGEEAGCEEIEEYYMLTNNLIRGISGSF